MTAGAEMRCPHCEWLDSKVVDSREVDDGVRRRRECLNPDCGGRFTTYERVQAVALYVIKKDGRREEFSREKLLTGLHKACEKRPLEIGAIESLAGDIESTLYQANTPEIPSAFIGELVMDRLSHLDPIAYVRFASVYRQFADLDALKDELEALASGSRPAGAQLPLMQEPEFAPPSLRLRPAAPNNRTRTRRPVRPVQTPTPMPGKESASEVQPKRRRRAR
ncbi:MAG: transcriptional regulator NrdR [Dehalococcoidia bacterium]